MTSTNFEVDRTGLSKTQFIDIPDADSLSLAANEVVISVDKFALTANNITYGVAGDMLSYWNFFPAKDNWGRIPVWGFGTVLSSNSDGMNVGDRYYGYFPMSTYLVVSPARINERGFVDGSAHRADLPPTYNHYSKVTEANGFDPKFDNHQMVYRPLFTTSFVLDDFFDDNDFYGAQKIILSSASSKTSFGLAHLLHKNRDQRVIGLTSPGNVNFVEGLGIYDEVVTYDNIAALDKSAPVAFIDMAGNRAVLEALHKHFTDNMKYSCGVGITHWETMGAARTESLPGAKPEGFFAPSQIQKRTKEWGAEKFQRELASAWSDFLAVVDNWVDIQELSGQDALLATYQKVLGSAPPNQGYVLTL
ncbi:MAG: DUF2855 family protein [Pseudomonadales bacterium]